MNVNQMRELFHATNNYTKPALENGALYYGLDEEAGEVMGQMKRHYRDDSGLWNQERVRKITMEMMDVLWYAIEIDWYLNLGVVDCLSPDKRLNTLQRDTCKEFDDITQDQVDRGYFLNEIIRNATVILNDYARCTPLSTMRVNAGVSIMNIIASICCQLRAMGVNLDDSASSLVEKLKHRQESGLIKGEGSER